jgi:hypothetical protein
MGGYSKTLRNKTDEELNKIYDSITTYTAEFIDDFLDELDIRRMLSTMKKRISEKDLITLINKLDSISTSKYLNFLKHELEIRGSEKIKSHQTYEYPKTESKKSSNYSYYGLISILALCAFLFKKYNENKPRQNFNNEITVPSVNPSYGLPPNSPTNNNFGSDKYFTPEKENFNIPPPPDWKKSEIKLPKIVHENPDLKLPEILGVKRGNNLNPGFQEILDTISKRKRI